MVDVRRLKALDGFRCGAFTDGNEGVVIFRTSSPRVDRWLTAEGAGVFAPPLSRWGRDLAQRVRFDPINLMWNCAPGR